MGRINYQEAWAYQEELFKATVQRKFDNRKRPDAEKINTQNYLLFCQHPHVYTLGKSGKPEHLLADEQKLKALGAQYYKINRGGDITYHGPGQLVGYPVLDLDHFFPDIHRYLRYLEEIFIQILSDYGLKGERSKGESGVWLETGTARARKILALGVRASRWVTMHGWAFNVNTDLNYFKHIVPCGIRDKEVTSLAKELGAPVSMTEIENKAQEYFCEIFNVELI